MPEKNRYWVPSRSYDIQLKIGELDYSQDIINMVLLSSVTTPYQTVILNLNLDPNDIILDKLYGQTHFKLTIRLLGDISVPTEQINIDLMYVSSTFKIPMRTENPQNTQKDRVLISIVTICRKAFKTMSTIINDVYFAKSLRTIINNIITGNTNAEIDYHTSGENTNIIDQVLLPPTTLYQTIKYLDNKFGLYSGVPSINCLYDNKIHIKNLTKKMSESTAFNIYQLSTSSDNSKIINKSNDGDNYYTYDDIKTSYAGNTTFSIMAPSLKYIVKPSDTLSYTIEKNLEELSQTYGLVSKNNEIFFDEEAINVNERVRYYTNQVGYEKTDQFLISEVSKRISSLSTISFMLERNLPILNLMKVGEAVKFISKTIDLNQFNGKYILKGSEINFVKEGEWQTTAKIYLIRTNRSST